VRTTHRASRVIGHDIDDDHDWQLRCNSRASTDEERSMSRSVVIVIFVTACTATTTGGGRGDGGGGGGGGNNLTPSDFIAKMDQLDCTEAFMCMASFPTTSGGTFQDAFGASVADCETQEAMYDDPTKVQAEITAGKIHFDGTAAAACVAGITYTDCATYWQSGGNFPAACDMAMVGTVADGGACVVDFDCSNVQSICDTTTMKCGPAPMQRKASLRGFDLAHAMY
jgi:hypothetical protein